MSYLKEICYRLIYILLLFCFIFFELYLNKDTIFILFLNDSFFNLNNSFFEIAFICDSPIHIIDIYLNIITFFSFLYVIPIFFIECCFFFFSALKNRELKFFKKMIFIYSFLFYLIHFYFCFYFLPRLWFFFEYLNLDILNLSVFNIEYEPNFIKYIDFIVYFIILSGALYFIIFSFFYFFFRHKLNYNFLKFLYSFAHILNFFYLISHLTIINFFIFLSFFLFLFLIFNICFFIKFYFILEKNIEYIIKK